MVLSEMPRSNASVESKDKGKGKGVVKHNLKDGKWYKLTQALAKAVVEGRRADARRIAALIVIE